MLRTRVTGTAAAAAAAALRPRSTGPSPWMHREVFLRRPLSYSTPSSWGGAFLLLLRRRRKWPKVVTGGGGARVPRRLGGRGWLKGSSSRVSPARWARAFVSLLACTLAFMRRNRKKGEGVVVRVGKIPHWVLVEQLCPCLHSRRFDSSAEEACQRAIHIAVLSSARDSPPRRLLANKFVV